METPMFPTHLFESDFVDVYEPAEDSFLLIDAIEKDLQLIKDKEPLICVEVGCGSGVIITSLAKALGSSSIYFATDINPRATSTTSKCAKVNQLPDDALNLIVCDLASPIEHRLNGSVDILIFNPPYVPTEQDELKSAHSNASGVLSHSWAGGLNGRQVIDRFLTSTVPLLLSPEGLLYLIIIRENNLEEICSSMKQMGFNMNVVLERKCGCEFLMALRFSRTST